MIVRNVVALWLSVCAVALMAADVPKPAELAKKPMYERLLKGEDAKTAAALEKNYLKAMNAEKWEEAWNYARELIEFRTRKQGADHYEVTDAVRSRENIDIERKLSVDDRKKVRESYQLEHKLIALYQNGQLLQAVKLGQQIATIHQKLLGENHPYYAQSLNNLAALFQAMGEYAKAEPLLLQSFDLRRRLLGENHPDFAQSVNNLAAYYHSIGEYTRAERLSVQARDLFKRLKGENHQDFALGLNNLAALYESMGEYDKAKRLLVQACDLQKRLQNEEDPDYALTLNNLAGLYRSTGEYAKAEPLLVQACDLYKKQLGENHPDYALSLNNLAGLFESMGNYSKAELLLVQARDLRRKQIGENHPDYALSLNNLAGLYRSTGEYAKADPLLVQARDLYKKLLGESHPDYALSLNNLAFLYQSMEAYARAEPLLRECARSYEMSRLARGSGFQRAIGGEGGNPFPFLAIVSARLNKARPAYDSLERDLARAMLDIQAERRGQRMTPDQQARRTRILANLAPLDKRIGVLATRPKLAEEETKELVLNIEQRRILNVELADLAVELSTREISDFATIQKAIASGSALLAWIEISARDDKVQEHWACIVKSTGEPIWVQLPGTGPDGNWTMGDRQLPGQFRKELSLASPSQSRIESLAKKLHTQRIAPVLKHLDGVTTLYVVGVNQMAGIPVSLLTDQFVISYIPSGTYLARLTDHSVPTRTKVLALGDAIYTKQDPNHEQQEIVRLPTRDWTDLPGTRVETNRLQQLFGDSAKVLTDSGASEQTLESLRKSGELSKYRYLHFATHGEGNNVKAFESALILSQDQLPKDNLPKAGEPWINGQLSAREVLDHWKLNAELVTLSACETAIGKSGGGDGLLGFAQAFLTAGARSVCLSLWKVDDTATALLMSRFYENLLGKREGLTNPLGKAAALDEAKRWLRNLSAEEALTLTAKISNGVARGSRGKGVDLKVVATEMQGAKPFAHPKYWAAFILIGDPE